MKQVLLFFAIIFFYKHLVAQQLTYPMAQKNPVTDTFFGKYKIVDNYRWMENPESPELENWVAAENAISEKFLKKASVKDDALQFITHLYDVNYHIPVKSGKYYFTYAYVDGISEPVLFIQRSLFGDSRRIVDPNYISRKDKITIRGIRTSHDSKYMAYEFSRNGSDWTEIKVTETEGTDLKDHLTNVRFSNIAWHGDGFFYSAYQNRTRLAAAKGQTILYHRLGAAQADDKAIFKTDDPDTFLTFLTTTDDRYFILDVSHQASGVHDYYYIDYNDPEPVLKTLLPRMKERIDIIDSHEGKLIARNFIRSDMGSIVEIDPGSPYKWRAIVPEYSEALLEDVLPLKNKIVAAYRSKITEFLVTTDYNGKLLNTVSLPPGTSLQGLQGSADDTELLYSFQSYTLPPVTYLFNTETYESQVTKITTMPYDDRNFIYKEAKYKVNDSVAVPMLIVYKKGIKMTGDNPTLLEAYGGFGVVSEPHFDPGLVYFLKNGGVFAYAYIRGGGELGSKWASAGRGEHKQNSFDDFIAGAEYLIKQGYTSPEKLAITGASNGGLVVAAAAIQRPDLFKVAVPVVAPFDMLRFENFTVGTLDADEYGSVKDSASFVRLSHYSPYNNIRDDVNYPAMLVITSENDDRVPPLHSFKFVARMQSRPVQTNPILLLVNKKAGHYGIAGNSFNDDLKSKAILYGFIVQMLK